MTQRLNDHVVDLIPAYVGRTLAAAATESVRAHVASCDECHGALAEWEAIAAALQATGPGVGAPARGLMDRVFQKIDAAEASPRWYERWIPGALRRPTARRVGAGAMGALALAFTLTFTPVGSYAQGLLDRFQPQQFAVVPVTMADLQALPSLRDYGDLSSISHGKPHKTAGVTEAARSSGLKVLTPGNLPAAVTSAPGYAVVPSMSATYTFSAAKTRETAQAQGKALPPMPAGIDGSSIQITTGTGVVAIYGGEIDFGLVDEGKPVPPSAKSAGGASQNPEDFASKIPQLIVGQAQAPTAVSRGASPKDLEQYVLSQPGISKNLANVIQAIGDPTVVWPIPVPVGHVNTHSATVQGVRGTVFVETSGFVTGVIWVRDGMVYGVASPLGEADVLSVANSLR